MYGDMWSGEKMSKKKKTIIYLILLTISIYIVMSIFMNRIDARRFEVNFLYNTLFQMYSDSVGINNHMNFILTLDEESYLEHFPTTTDDIDFYIRTVTVTSPMNGDFSRTITKYTMVDGEISRTVIEYTIPRQEISFTGGSYFSMGIGPNSPRPTTPLIDMHFSWLSSPNRSLNRSTVHFSRLSGRDLREAELKWTFFDIEHSNDNTTYEEFAELMNDIAYVTRNALAALSLDGRTPNHRLTNRQIETILTEMFTDFRRLRGEQ